MITLYNLVWKCQDVTCNLFKDSNLKIKRHEFIGKSNVIILRNDETNVFDSLVVNGKENVVLEIYFRQKLPKPQTYIRDD